MRRKGPRFVSIGAAPGTDVAARAANGGSDDFLKKISDRGLKDTCRDFNIQINEAFVD